MPETPLLSQVHEDCAKHRANGDKVIGVTFNPTGWEQVQDERDAWLENPPEAPKTPVTLDPDQDAVYKVQRIPAEIREEMPVREQVEIAEDFQHRCEQAAQARFTPVKLTIGDLLGEDHL